GASRGEGFRSGRSSHGPRGGPLEPGLAGGRRDRNSEITCEEPAGDGRRRRAAVAAVLDEDDHHDLRIVDRREGREPRVVLEQVTVDSRTDNRLPSGDLNRPGFASR